MRICLEGVRSVVPVGGLLRFCPLGAEIGPSAIVFTPVIRKMEEIRGYLARREAEHLEGKRTRRREMTLRDALAFLCAREIARKERAIVRHWTEDNGERRIDMSFGLAKFPFARDFGGFGFGFGFGFQAPSPRSTGRRSATSPPGASSPMATRSCC